MARSPSRSSTSNSRVLGQLNHRLDEVKGVVHPNTCLYLVGEENLHTPPPPPPRVLKVKKKKAVGGVNAPDTQVRDFIPWVRP